MYVKSFSHFGKTRIQYGKAMCTIKRAPYTVKFRKFGICVHYKKDSFMYVTYLIHMGHDSFRISEIRNMRTL